MKEDYKVGDRVYVAPYDCMGTVVRVQWREEFKLSESLTISENIVYWVKLEEKDLKPRGFSNKCLRKQGSYTIGRNQ